MKMPLSPACASNSNATKVAGLRSTRVAAMSSVGIKTNAATTTSTAAAPFPSRLKLTPMPGNQGAEKGSPPARNSEVTKVATPPKKARAVTARALRRSRVTSNAVTSGIISTSKAIT